MRKYKGSLAFPARFVVDGLEASLAGEYEQLYNSDFTAFSSEIDSNQLTMEVIRDAYKDVIMSVLKPFLEYYSKEDRVLRLSMYVSGVYGDKLSMRMLFPWYEIQSNFVEKIVEHNLYKAFYKYPVSMPEFVPEGEESLTLTGYAKAANKGQ